MGSKEGDPRVLRLPGVSGIPRMGIHTESSGNSLWSIDPYRTNLIEQNDRALEIHKKSPSEMIKFSEAIREAFVVKNLLITVPMLVVQHDNSRALKRDLLISMGKFWNSYAVR